MRNWSQHIAIAIIYASFYGLVGLAIWLTGSLMPLWALLLTPNANVEKKN